MSKTIHLSFHMPLTDGSTVYSLHIFPGDLREQVCEYLRNYTQVRGQIVLIVHGRFEFTDIQDEQTIEAMFTLPALDQRLVAHLHHQRMNPGYFIQTAGSLAVPATMPTITV